VEENAYIGELTAAVVYLIAAIRLLHLSVRTRGVPERLLGLMFGVTGASLLLYQVPILLESERLWTPLNFAARVGYIPAPVLLAIFTRKVFRRTAVWGAWIPYGSALLLVTGVGVSALRGDWEGFSISNPWFWPEWIGYTVPFAWAGVETFLEYTRARRRLHLGLCAPLICNRFLLWALFGVMQVLVCLAVLPQYSEYESARAFSAMWDILVGGGETLSVALMWLAFFPPNFYRAWIERAPSIASGGKT
jgi:hypothetical protein